MGYRVAFDGQFDLDKPLTDAHRVYLTAFGRTRRVRRNALRAAQLPDPAREAADLPVGNEGGHFTGGFGFLGQDSDPSVIDPNAPPDEQPCVWCKWVPNPSGTAIMRDWHDVDSGYFEFADWLRYLIDYFLTPWGYTLRGSVRWRGEDAEDRGTITVDGTAVHVRSDAEQARLERDVAHVELQHAKADAEQAVAYLESTVENYRAALRALVSSLPACDWNRCVAHATHVGGSSGTRWCRAHAPEGSRAYPHAGPLEAALRLLATEPAITTGETS